MISTVVGILLITKYVKYREINLLLVGITWIGLFSPWWPSMVSFILALTRGNGLSAATYFLVGFIISPVVLTVWMIAFTNFRAKGSQKPLVYAYLVIGVLFDVYLIYAIFTDPSQIGELTGALDSTYRGIAIVYSLFIIVTILITGILFGQKALRSEHDEIQLKGKLLILAFVSWTIGAVLDAALPLNLLTLTIARIILISSAIEFYLGFTLPDFIKRWLL